MEGKLISNEFQKVAVTSILLFLIPFFTSVWFDFANTDHYFKFVRLLDGAFVVDLNNPEPYKLNGAWHAVLFADRLKLLIYAACLLINADFKSVLKVPLWVFYVLFELVQTADYYFFYNQLPYSRYFSYLLFTYQVFYVAVYFWKYELKRG